MHKEKGKLYFIFALHNHQPVGNFSEVMESNFEKAYQPFLDVISRYPGIKFTLHNTGILLEWFRNNRPDYLDLLKNLIERGQVEIMGGGFYEPILPVITDEDKKGQIDKLTGWLREHLGVTPAGMWLAERIWEPGLARPIADVGLDYITVDDSHFSEVGFENLSDYYVTEEEGRRLNIFPINEKLRYLIPFRPPVEAINYLREFYNENENRVLVLADDGEKFGGWPQTHKAVYEKKWLERFFDMIGDNRDWLQTTTFSEYMSIAPPRGLVYLPASSYREMKEWSRGFWRNFFIRYPESNRMHKKMLSVRRRIEEMPQGEERNKALDHLWAGQCNCAYWHGVFGGLYLNFLRAGVWENLLKAEEEAEKTLGGGGEKLEFRQEDRDYDGKEEVAVISDRFSLLFSPHLGGSMWEFSWRPAPANFLDTLTRREEDYHRELADETKEGEGGDTQDDVKSIHDTNLKSGEDLSGYLIYDRYQRGGLIEHFFPGDITLEQFRTMEYREGDGNNPLRPAEMELRHPERGESGSEEGTIIFRRTVQTGGTELLLAKEILCKAGSDLFEVKYYLENRGGRACSGWFGVEFNLALLSGSDEKRYYEIPGRDLSVNTLDSAGEEESVEMIGLRDDRRGFGIFFNLSRPSRLWRFPVETISRSEEGLEKVYQQSLILPQWQIDLQPGQNWDLVMSVEVKGVPGEYGVSAEKNREVRR